MSCRRISRLSPLLQSLSRNTITTTANPRLTSPTNNITRSSFHTAMSPIMAQRNLDSQTISEITHKENELTGQPDPVKGGPTAQAQAHANANLSAQRVSEIAKGENVITSQGGPVAGGPTAFAQSEAANTRNAVHMSPFFTHYGFLLENELILSYELTTHKKTLAGKQTHTGRLDSETISRITEAEKELTGQPRPVKGGPTAQAQKHVGEKINSDNLHDITEGEKRVTATDHAVKGGPTSTAQSELGKSRAS